MVISIMQSTMFFSFYLGHSFTNLAVHVVSLLAVDTNAYSVLA